MTISADADITIQSAKGKLVLSGKGVEISSQADVKIKASTTMSLNGTQEVKVEGEMIKLN